MSGDALPAGGFGNVAGDVTGGAVDGAHNVAIGKEISMHINDESLASRHDRDMMRNEANTLHLMQRADDHERRLTRVEDRTVANTAEIGELKGLFMHWQSTWHRATSTPVNWTLVIFSALLALMVAGGLVALGWAAR